MQSEDNARMDQELASALADLKRHFDVTAESPRSDIRLLGEGVLNGGRRLDQTAQELTSDLKAGFAETQAMIKFSHADLDRRISALEARVDRLEAITGNRT